MPESTASPAIRYDAWCPACARVSEHVAGICVTCDPSFPSARVVDRDPSTSGVPTACVLRNRIRQAAR